MIRLFLVRHGNTFEKGQIAVQVGARTDLSLTEEGCRQAKKMAEYLLKHQIFPVAFYRGNLKRQTEFAEIMSKPFHPLLISEPALTEIDYGPWEGLTSEKIAEQWPTEYAEWNESAKWPEKIFPCTYQSHKQALDEWLKKIENEHPPGNSVVAVSSNGLLRLLKNEKVKTGHFCELHLHSGRFEIKSWNQSPDCLS